MLQKTIFKFSQRKTRFSSKLLQQTVPHNVSDGRFDTRKAYATIGANRVGVLRVVVSSLASSI
jgi:hypothetical protein